MVFKSLSDSCTLLSKYPSNLKISSEFLVLVCCFTRLLFTNGNDKYQFQLHTTVIFERVLLVVYCYQSKSHTQWLKKTILLHEISGNQRFGVCLGIARFCFDVSVGQTNMSPELCYFSTLLEVSQSPRLLLLTKFSSLHLAVF